MKKINNKYFKNGMTLPEVLLASMVMVIFMGMLSLYSKYFQSTMKANSSLGNDKRTWIEKENIIYSAMDRWSEILAQPSYSKEEILSLGCKYNISEKISFWNKPGLSDDKLPKNYKYCLYSTPLGESSLSDLISAKPSARPGIYILYAIPDKITQVSKPIRRLFCRPIQYC